MLCYEKIVLVTPLRLPYSSYFNITRTVTIFFGVYDFGSRLFAFSDDFL